MTDIARRWPTAPPDGLLAAALLAFLATAGFFYVNIMAALVAGLVDGLGFTESDAGRVGSLNIYGAAFGALIAIAIVGRVRWRAFAIFALIALMTIDALSIFVVTPKALMAMRFLHGSVGGLLVGVAYSVFARTRTPDRVFGMLLVIQYGLGGLGIMLLPRLVPLYGHAVLFIALIAFSFVTFLMLPFLDSYPRGRILRPVAADGIRWGLLAATVASVFLFQAGNMALAVYLIPLARHFGLGTEYASTALGLATWVGIAGCAAVVVFGTRFGRTWPLAVGAVLTVAGSLAFHWSASPTVYLLANCVTSITWSFVISYLLGMCAEFDQTGRTAALGGFLSKLGLASGPFVAAWLLESGDYTALINISAIVLAMSVPVMFVPARTLDRAKEG
jgi:predicted MFS family arabinose efflux permease